MNTLHDFPSESVGPVTGFVLDGFAMDYQLAVLTDFFDASQRYLSA
jgi:hypothetical protein